MAFDSELIGAFSKLLISAMLAKNLRATPAPEQTEQVTSSPAPRLQMPQEWRGLRESISNSLKTVREPLAEPLAEPTVQSKGQEGKIAGFNIGSYATGAGHEKIVQSIYQALQNKEIGKHIQTVAPKAAVTEEMIQRSAGKHGVDARLMTALMQADSHFGTKGKGRRTLNPGNVGNTDSGATKKFSSWDEGVDAVAQWLANNRS